jgi:hypothetical protein
MSTRRCLFKTPVGDGSCSVRNGVPLELKNLYKSVYVHIFLYFALENNINVKNRLTIFATKHVRRAQLLYTDLHQGSIVTYTAVTYTTVTYTVGSTTGGGTNDPRL